MVDDCDEKDEIQVEGQQVEVYVENENIPTNEPNMEQSIDLIEPEDKTENIVENVTEDVIENVNFENTDFITEEIVNDTSEFENIPEVEDDIYEDEETYESLENFEDDYIAKLSVDDVNLGDIIDESELLDNKDFISDDEK